MNDKIDMVSPECEVAAIANNLYENIVDSGPIDVHSASLTWLDKTGDKMTMRISKVLNG